MNLLFDRAQLTSIKNGRFALSLQSYEKKRNPKKHKLLLPNGNQRLCDGLKPLMR